ncbi:S8 family serine peptidase [Myxococcota bacterium]|nr:S8 family serine peptidase [Myxococcota bacterium]
MPEELVPPVWQGDEPADPGLDWALRDIDLSAAWAHTRGESWLRVAIVDTGCRADHPDLAGAVVGWHDEVAGDNDPTDPLEHGTALAARVAARVDDAGLVGVAPEVSLVCIRVVEADGRALYEVLAGGIDRGGAAGASVVLVGLAGTGEGADGVECMAIRVCQQFAKRLAVTNQSGVLVGGMGAKPPGEVEREARTVRFASHIGVRGAHARAPRGWVEVQAAAVRDPRPTRRQPLDDCLGKLGQPDSHG